MNPNKTFKWFFILSILWIITDGIFRKWLLFSLSAQLFYVKYMLFGVTYAFFILSKYPFPIPKKNYQLFILFYIVLCLLGLLNKTLPNPVFIAIVGVIIHVFFVPLSHITQYLVFKPIHLKKLVNWIAYLSFPLGILGAIQFYLPVDHPINGFANDFQLYSKTGGFTRISSVFSFVKIYNAYLLFSISLIVPGILNKLRNNKSVLLYSIALFLLIINMFMTGSRLPIALMLVFITLQSIYVFINFANLRKTIFVVFTIGLIALIGMYFTTGVVGDSVDATISRIENAEARHRNESTGFTDMKLRLEDRLDIFKFSESAGFMGYGIGLTYQGNQGSIKTPIPFYFEEEGERLVLELGIIGGIIIILLRFFIIMYSIFLMRNCRNLELKIMILALVLYIIPALFTIQMTTFSYMENFFYWFAFGLIIAISKIDTNLEATV